MWTYKSALAGALLVAVCTPAAAATTAGPLLRLSVEGRHDADVRGSYQAGSMILQPSAGFWVDSPTLRSDARYAADLRAYPGGSPVVPTPNHRLEATQALQLDDASDLSLRQHAELVGDPTSLSRLGIARSFGRTRWLQLEGTYHRAFSRRDSAFVGYEGNAVFYADPALQDGMSHAPFLWLRRQMGARDGLGVRARLQLFDDLGGGSTTSYEPGITWERRLTELWDLELEAGPAILAGESTRVLPRGKVLVRARTPHASVLASYERTFLGATGIPGAVWADVVTGHYSYRFDTIWSFGVGAGVFRTGTSADGPRALTGAMTSATLGWRFAPQLSAGLSWRLALQDQGPGVASSVPPIFRNIFAAGVTWDMDGGRVPR